MEVRDHGPLRLDHQLCFPLYAATNLLQRLYRPLLEPIGLTYTQYLVMLLLWERGSATVGDVRNCLHLDPGTVSPLLKRMEKAGLVSRERDGRDERKVIIRPTGAGQRLRDAAREVPRSLAERVGIDLQEASEMHRLTTKLVQHLVQAAF